MNGINQSARTYEKLDYNLPNLGRISAYLCRRSLECYHFLDEEDFIIYLKEIDHLGIIRRVQEGAHHPRWEYVMLQLSLLSKLYYLLDDQRKEVRTYLGLNTDKIDDLSGIEVISIWILLLNTGHLPYTFASERALLKFIKENQSISEDIRNTLPEEIQEEYDSILKDEDVYSLHKIIISLRMTSNEHHQTNLFQLVLNNYINNDLDDMKFIFKRIRLLSYLFLDSHYSSFPIALDMSNIFFNLQYYFEDLFKKQGSQIKNTLDAFENLISYNLYNSAETLKEYAHHFNVIENRLNEKVKNLNDLINFISIKNIDNFKSEPVKWGKLSYLQIIIDLVPNESNKTFYDVLNEIFCFNSENELNEKYEDKDCSFILHKSANARHFSLLTYSDNNSEPLENLTVFFKEAIGLEQHIKSRLSNENENTDIVDDVLQESYKRLIEHVIISLDEEKIFIKFKQDFNERIMTFNNEESFGLVKNKINIIKETIYDVSRLNEIECLKIALNEIIIDDNDYSVLVSIPQIIINYLYGPNSSKCELDGFALIRKESELFLLFVEGKKGGNSPSVTAKESLKAKLDILEIYYDENNFKPIYDEPNKGAYYLFKLDSNLLVGNI